MSRPELVGDASIFYNSKEARKYNSSSRMIGVQREITERAIELLKLPTDRPCFILDVGCGSGLSGRVLEEKGHVWVGLDVSRDMLNVANERMEGKREQMNEMEGESSEDDEEEDEDMDEDDPKGMHEGTSTSTGDLLHHVSLSNY
jgi:SAM-dependent methyltransferase